MEELVNKKTIVFNDRSGTKKKLKINRRNP